MYSVRLVACHFYLRGQKCVVDDTLISIAGSPCVDFSKQGKQLGKEGPTAMTFLAITTWHVHRRTPILCLENVQQFDDTLVHTTLGATHHIYKLNVSPADTGFGCNTRDRTYHLCFDKTKVEMVADVSHVYNTIKGVLSQGQVSAEAVWFEDRVDQLQHEMHMLGRWTSYIISSVPA